MAVALMANNAVALVFTIVFARLLGPSSYGALGALLAAFTILLVPGSALQTAVAREVSAAAVTPGEDPTAGVRRWISRLLIATAGATVLGILTREPAAGLIGVEQEWAAAAVLPSAGLWLVLCVERGALQGFRSYRAVAVSIVGEAGARLLLGVCLYGLGLGVTGAFLGTTLSVAAMGMALAPVLLRRLHAYAPPSRRAGDFHLRHLLARSGVPLAALALIAALQNIDIVFVNREASDVVASAYVAASVAAKAVIWVAIGLGLYLLPEAVRRSRAGGDARPVLLRTLGLIAAVAVPMIVVYLAAGRQVLEIAFGEDLAGASDALVPLALGMSLLASVYLSVQYLLALGRVAFVLLLVLAPAVELAVLLIVGAEPADVAAVVAAVQLVLAPTVFAVAFRSAAHRL